MTLLPDVRGQIVGAAERRARRRMRLADRVRWPQGNRARAGVVIAAVVLLGGSSAAAVVSLTSVASRPLSGALGPASPGGGSRSAAGVLAPNAYSIAVTPLLDAGAAGWSSTITYRLDGRALRSVGVTGYATRTMPLFGGSGYALSSAGTGRVVEYVLSGPGVAAVRFGSHVVRTRGSPALPAGVRAAVTVLGPGAAAVLIPPAGSSLPRRVQIGGHSLRTVAMLPLDARGRVVPYALPRGPAREHVVAWTGPASSRRATRAFAGAACVLSLDRARAIGGAVLRPISPIAGATAETLLSCASTTFLLDGHRLQAAALVDARRPGSRPGALPGARAVAGHPGWFTSGASGTGAPLVARRTGHAWLVVQGALDRPVLIRALAALRLAQR